MNHRDPRLRPFPAGALVLAALLAGLAATTVPARAEQGVEVVSREVYDLGATPVGTPLERSFRVRNPSPDHPARIDAFAAEAPGFVVQAPAATIAAGETVSIQVTLTAEEPGEYALAIGFYLVVEDGEERDPLVQWQVRGEVITAPAPSG